jgi:hypothetical protein
MFVFSYFISGLDFNHNGTLLAMIAHGIACWDAGEIILWAVAAPPATKYHYPAVIHLRG